jgi:hypothetical protein
MLLDHQLFELVFEVTDVPAGLAKLFFEEGILHLHVQIGAAHPQAGISGFHHRLVPLVWYLPLTMLHPEPVHYLHVIAGHFCLEFSINHD